MSRNKDFDATFSSKTYLVVRDDNRGFVSDGPTIRLSPQDYTKESLYVSVHESLHAEFVELTEAQVIKSARHISDFLWQLGYRVPRPRKKKT
jgi:hypothetical protein